VVRKLSFSDIISILYNKEIDDYWIQIKLENGRLHSFWYTSNHINGDISFILVDEAKEIIDSVIQMEEL
jgi:hypothetical protein